MTHPGWSGLGYVDPAREPWYVPIQPAVVLRKIEELDDQNDQLAERIRVKQTGPLAERFGADFIRDWNAYLAEWRAWRDEHTGWFSRWSSDAVETLAHLINRSNTYDARLRDAGIDPGTMTQEEAEQREREQQPGLPTWGWVLIGLGAVGLGGYLLYTVSRIMREGRLIASDARGGVRGIGGPTRVSDLDGPSTYNLEIES